jgi:uncharacterized protein (TIGR02757 family)
MAKQSSRNVRPARPPDLRALRSSISRVVRTCDVDARLRRDPVELVRRVSGDADRELAGLVGACLAFGNVATIRASIEDVLARLGPGVGERLDDVDRARAALAGTGHRMLRDDDITRLLLGARAMQRRHGRLGDAFASRLRQHGGDLRPALIDWTAELREEGGLRADGARRGPAHILPDPGKNSGCKRLMLYLRWMVRRDDGVDLGLWRAVSPSALLIPVDTHILRLARNLGLTSCTAPSWRAAEEITAILRRIDPDDPVRFDFALCHLGMVQGCPSRRTPGVCDGCGVQGVCRHWARPR